MNLFLELQDVHGLEFLEESKIEAKGRNPAGIWVQIDAANLSLQNIEHGLRFGLLAGVCVGSQPLLGEQVEHRYEKNSRSARRVKYAPVQTL